MSEVTTAQLHAFLDDALSEPEMARVEQALRDSDALRQALRQALQERDRGDHSLGAVWRRERLTCPSRDKLGSYLLQTLDDAEQDYVEFHINTVACPCCVANLADLRQRQQEAAPETRQRRRRFFETSARLLSRR